MDRTEELKKSLSDENESIRNIKIPTIQRQESLRSTEYKGNREELLRLTATTPQIQTAIEIAASGELYAHEGNFAVAFEKYQLALGKLLDLLQNEPKGRRKDLLRAEVTRWMSQAENLKEVLNGSVSQGSDTAALSIEGDDKNCCLQ